MTARNRVDRYAVVGNPVAHSLSPKIHSAFAEQTGEALSYAAIEIPTDAFANGTIRHHLHALSLYYLSCSSFFVCIVHLPAIPSGISYWGWAT